MFLLTYTYFSNLTNPTLRKATRKVQLLTCKMENIVKYMLVDGGEKLSMIQVCELG